MRQLMIRGTLVLVVLAAMNQAHAQPANDECTQATELSLVQTGSCGGVVGDNGSATHSGILPSCDGVSTDGYQDVWYSFNTGDNSQISITLAPITAADWNYMVFDACGGNELACYTIPTGTQTFNVPANTTYLVLVESNLDYGTGGTFNLCIEANNVGGGGGGQGDDCGSAGVLTMGTACSPVDGTTAGATSSGLPIGCTLQTFFADVWYSFVAQQETAYVSVDPLSTNNPAVAIYSGTCSDLTEIGCQNNAGGGSVENILLFNLVIGDTYYLRIYDDDFDPDPMDLTICVWAEPPPPPAPDNDECFTPQVLATNVACAPITADAAGATPSFSGSGCNGNTGSADDDVWFRFIATAGNVRITVDGNGTGGGAYDPIVELLYTENCSSFNQLACANATGTGGIEVIDFEGVAIGVAYYVLVYDAGTGQPANTTFTICVQDIGTADAVDDVLLPDDAWSVTTEDDALLIRTSLSGMARWSLVDVAGRIVRTGTSPVNSGTTIPVSTQGLASGITHLRLSLNGAQGVKRCLVD
jgi:hypothetical protein